jgi:SAM-dependent methyltransferase
LSGFSSEWLDLREPADHRARDLGLADELARAVSGRDTVRLLDLGCGTGSNLRALAPALSGHQHWTLIDHDIALLASARERVEMWLQRSGVESVAVQYETADLRHHLAERLDREHDIVTAAALFDLVSPAWIEDFVAALTARRSIFYTVLIYDGQMSWSPAHPADEAVCAAFNAHQHGDKGFGPAAGPDAGRVLAEALERAGYRVATAPSPWRLERADLALIKATAQGIADAARETGRIAPADLDDWLESRTALTACEIGHLDLLALP